MSSWIGHICRRSMCSPPGSKRSSLHFAPVAVQERYRPLLGCASARKTDMNQIAKRRSGMALKPLTLLFLVSFSPLSLAANLRDVLSGRPDARPFSTYGRESVYAFSTTSKRNEIAQSRRAKSYQATSAQKSSTYAYRERHAIGDDQWSPRDETLTGPLESDRGSNVALDRQENSSTSELSDMAVAHVDGKYRNTSGVLGFQQLYRK